MTSGTDCQSEGERGELVCDQPWVRPWGNGIASWRPCLRAAFSSDETMGLRGHERKNADTWISDQLTRPSVSPLRRWTRGWQTFPSKSQTINTIGFAAHMISITAQLCYCSRKTAIDHTGGNECECLPIKLCLWKLKLEFQIICTCHKRLFFL